MAEMTYHDDRWMISGDLNFMTVPNLWNQSISLLPNYQELHFDLNKVNSSNSAGLALLLEWIKYAKRHNKKVTFSHVPKQLVLIADAAGVSI